MFFLFFSVPFAFLLKHVLPFLFLDPFILEYSLQFYYINCKTFRLFIIYFIFIMSSFPFWIFTSSSNLFLLRFLFNLVKTSYFGFPFQKKCLYLFHFFRLWIKQFLQFQSTRVSFGIRDVIFTISLFSLSFHTNFHLFNFQVSFFFIFLQNLC